MTRKQMMLDAHTLGVIHRNQMLLDGAAIGTALGIIMRLLVTYNAATITQALDKINTALNEPERID